MRDRWRRHREVPSREFVATSQTSIWFLPPSPVNEQWQRPKSKYTSNASRFCHRSVIKTVTVLTCSVHKTFAAAPLARCDSCELWRKYLRGPGSLLGNHRKITYIVQHVARRSLFVTSQTMHGMCQRRAAAATQRRSRLDLDLSAYAVAAGRLQLPAPADMFGLWRRGDRTFRIMGRGLGDAGGD